jgi:hypothetical protein
LSDIDECNILSKSIIFSKNRPFKIPYVKADDKIPNIAGIKFPTYNRTIVSMRGAMVHDYERGIFYDQRDV